jgi:hypothetical protein
MPLSLTTLSLMTLNKALFSIKMTLSIMIHGIMPLYRITLHVMTLGIMIHRIMTLCIITLSQMTFTITALSLITLIMIHRKCHIV